MSILQQALNSGIINLDNVQQEIAIMNRKQILNQHQFNIYKGEVKSNGKSYSKWITYIIKDGKRRQVKRNSKEELEDYLIEYYTKSFDNECNSLHPTFKDYYFKWKDFKAQIVSDNTIYKYETDYRRFLKDSEFENMDISAINEQHIILYLTHIIKTIQPLPRALKGLCGYINEIFDYALCDRIIDINPYMYVKPKLKLFIKQCKYVKPKTDEDRTISSDDMIKLLNQLNSDYKNKPYYITPYAIEFALLTGCRVGEIAALRWEDIDDQTITIRHSEKAHKENGRIIGYTIERTKTGKERKIPMTKALKSLFERVSIAEENINCKTEFVFSDDSGRISGLCISSCMRYKCIQANIKVKSIHACRRTVNSMLKNLGANTAMAASLLGHTKEVNESYYTYDVSNLDMKKAILEMANSRLIREA